MAGHLGEAERIVVGVDGSDSSKQALRWAIRQAELTHGAVEAVIAWQYPRGSIGWLPPTTDELNFEQMASKVLTEAIDEAVGQQPPVALRTTVAYGSAADVLLAAARGASLLVLGNRGHGGFTETLLGSVGQHCTQHAPCPVVIVRGPAH